MNSELNKIKQRLQLLEEKFEHQDNTIDTLNDVVINQQNEIETLQLKLEELKDSLSSSEHNQAPFDTKPPHY